MATWQTEASKLTGTAARTLSDVDVSAALDSIAGCDVDSYEKAIIAAQEFSRLAAAAVAEERFDLVDRIAVRAAALMVAAAATQGVPDLLFRTAQYFRRTVGPHASLVLIDAALDQVEQYFEPSTITRQSAILSNFAGEIFRDLGELESAQQHYDWALATLALSPNDESELEGAIRNNVGLTLQARGDLDGARRELLRSLALSADPRSRGHAYTLDNLGSVERDLGIAFLNSSTADRLRGGETLRLAMDHLVAAQNIFRDLLPGAADDLVISLEESALVARALNDEQSWRASAVEADMLILTTELGADALWRAAVLKAELAVHDGFPELAAKVLISTWDEVRPQGAAAKHLEGLELLVGLIGRDGLDGPLPGVLSSMLGIEDAELDALLGRGSEREAVASFGNYLRRLYVLLGLVLPAGDGEVDSAIYEVVLDRKGLLAERRGRTSLQSHRIPQVASQAAEVRRLRAELARVDLDGAGQRSVQQARRQREQLALQFDRAEARLMQRLGVLDPVFVHRELWELQVALAVDELFVDLVQFIADDGQRHYVAFLIHHEGVVRVARLGEVGRIDQALRTFTLSPGLDAARSLATLMPGLAGLFGEHGVRRIIFAPTGAWCAMPLALLPGSDGGILIDRFVVTSVPSARWLIARRNGTSPAVSTGSAVVIGDPDYDMGAIENLDFLLRWRVDRLPHSRREAQHVAHILNVPAVLDREATRARLLGVSRPRILHIASHGTFLDARHSLRELAEPREYRIRAENGTVVMDDSSALGWERDNAVDPSAPVSRHLARLEWLRDIGPVGPGTRSAILLAGFNAWLAGSDNDDAFGTGLVTAGEFAMLDLSGTELVVLSACESGVGAQQFADGSQIGLRADALAAGASMCISSLWNVDDEITADLMECFYGHLVSGVPPSDALRQAQLEIRQAQPDPHFWGAWVLEGT